MKRKFIAFIVSVLFFNLSCAVTGPTVTRQEEEAARAQLKQADYRVWWNYQKRLFRVSDRFAWGVNTPGAPFRNGFGILPVLRKSASSYELGLYNALGNLKDGTVLHVSVGSPGEKAGLREGDVIVAIDDKDISAFSVGDLVDLAGKGQSRRFSFVKRGGGSLQAVTVTPARQLDIMFLTDRSSAINAHAGHYLGTNLVVFNYGLINLMEGDDELAVFVGHEVVHILKNHQDQSAAIQTVGAVMQLGIAIVGAARGVDTRSIQRGVSYLTQIVDIRYTRDQEREADYLGIYAALQAGFNVNAAAFAWEKFAIATPGGMYDHFLNNHPPNPERFVRIQKTIEEIRFGRTLQQAWVGEPFDPQLASNSSSIVIPPYTPTASSVPLDTSIPAALLSPSLSNTEKAPDKKPITKTYASLVQYDGPKVKSGVTLEAEFVEDGSGSGEGKVIYAGNRYFLAGSWTTLPPGQVEKPRLIDKKALNALRLLADTPLITSRFVDNDTVLECLHGETAFFGQRKGECQDNFGNKYHLVFRP